eukprot:112237_1
MINFPVTKQEIPCICPFFFMIPIATLLLIIAQIQTVKALFYMTKNVFERENAPDYLESIFGEYAAEDNVYWGVKEWKQFVFANTACQSSQLLETLWSILLFDVDNESILTLNDFKSIFEPHIVAKKVSDAESVTQMIAATIERLIHVLSTSKHTHTVALEVHQLILSLPNERDQGMKPSMSMQPSKRKGTDESSALRGSSHQSLFMAIGEDNEIELA